MIREFDLNCIQGVCDGMFFYEDDGKIEKIDIKKSAEMWWDKHHESSTMDVLLKKRTKNKYAEDKCFNFTESYIRLELFTTVGFWHLTTFRYLESTHNTSAGKKAA